MLTDQNTEQGDQHQEPNPIHKQSGGGALGRIQTVLIATDLTARGDRALARALMIAELRGAKLVVLHVIDDELRSLVMTRMREMAEEEIAGALQSLDPAPSIDIDIVISEGAAYREILNVAEAVSADLIVMGVHRNESRRFAVTGTTMERVARLGLMPVLVVVDRAEGDYQAPAAAVDLSVFSGPAVTAACDIADAGSVDLVHAYMIPFAGFLTGEQTKSAYRAERLAALQDFSAEETSRLAGRPSEASSTALKPVLCEGPPQQALREHLKASKTDLLVIGAHGRVGLERALLGSVAEDFLNSPPCDVLVVKAFSRPQRPKSVYA